MTCRLCDTKLEIQPLGAPIFEHEECREIVSNLRMIHDNHGTHAHRYWICDCIELGLPCGCDRLAESSSAWALRVFKNQVASGQVPHLQQGQDAREAQNV